MRSPDSVIINRCAIAEYADGSFHEIEHILGGRGKASVAEILNNRRGTHYAWFSYILEDYDVDYTGVLKGVDGPTSFELHYVRGELHRDDGPAKIWNHGRGRFTHQWYQNGRLHRDDGPAVKSERTDGWWVQGSNRKTDGPAVITYVVDASNQRLRAASHNYVGHPDFEDGWYHVDPLTGEVIVNDTEDMPF